MLLINAMQALIDEVESGAVAKLEPKIEAIVERKIAEYQPDPFRRFTIPAAVRHFGYSRQIIEDLLVRYSVPVRFIGAGGLGECRIFLYKDIAKAIESYVRGKS